MVYVDIKQLYDLVDTLLKEVGVPDVLQNLVHELPTSTGLRVHVGPWLLPLFFTNSGV